nr:MAG TPA: hypothetical protein [Caudoviricetes sp.]
MLSCFISFLNFFTLFRVFLYPVTFTLTVRVSDSFIYLTSYPVLLACT